MRVSAILPTFNRADLLGRALRSVLAQSRPCDEILIVDDGSEDRTGSVIDEIASSAAVAVRTLRQANQGAAAARNKGILAARGDILAFLDSDDRWHPRKIEKQLAALSANSAYRVAHTREIWYRRGVRVNQRKKHDPGRGDVFARSLGMCVVGMSTVMLRKEVFDQHGLFDPALPCCEDYDFWLRVSAQEPFLLVDEALTTKDGGRPDQLSAIHRVGMDVYRIRAIARLLETAPLTSEQRILAIQELQRKCGIYARGCRKHGRPGEATLYESLAWRHGSLTGNTGESQ